MQALKLEGLLRLLKLELLLKRSLNELEGKIYCIYMLVLLYKGLHVVIVQVQSVQNTRMCEYCNLFHFHYIHLFLIKKWTMSE